MYKSIYKYIGELVKIWHDRLKLDTNFNHLVSISAFRQINFLCPSIQTETLFE